MHKKEEMTAKEWLRPNLILVCGLPGSGKTTIARRLEQETGAIRLNIDEWVAALGVEFFDFEFRLSTPAVDRDLAGQGGQGRRADQGGHR